MDIYFPKRKKPIIPVSPPPKKGRRIWPAIFFAIILSGGYFIWSRQPESKNINEKPVAPYEAAAQEIVPEKPKENVRSYQISEGDIPAEVFAEQGKFDANEIESLLIASNDVYDFSKLKIGQNLEFIVDDKGVTEKIRYYPDTENVITATKENASFSVKKENIPYKTVEEITRVKIDEFLYKDALDEGLSESTILEIADIFSFDIDFTTEIQEGDEMTVIYEKRTLDGQKAPDGKVLAAKFRNTGQEYRGYYFESAGEGSHYDGEGHELMRQFLRAPLSYRQITSGYTGARRHPITKKVSAHYQIDYAAPSGTPVVATARGTVASAGWEGGWGNIVRLTHDNGYTTHYGHLSGYGKSVKSGASVSQGQVVGYVGSTGWSTGPHLDYGMRLDGNPINPLSLKLPKGTPLEGEERQKFEETKKKYDELLK